jgi:tRNA (guanine-N7-)-methyltransferase
MAAFGLLSPWEFLAPGWWRELAPDANRLEIELGPGDGKFLLAAARLNPRTFYLGIEIRSGLVQRLSGIDDRPANVSAIEADAIWVMTNLLAEGTVSAYHVYFPDPWWKKRHRKRRMFRPEVVEQFRRTLVRGGAIFVVTDVVPLFLEIDGLLRSAGFDAQAWQRDVEDDAQSSYERKYRRQGRSLESGRFVKRD